MGESINDGGPAFARPGSDWISSPGGRTFAPAAGGMSLRDYFAAAALTGVIHDVRAEMQRRDEWTGLEEEESDNAALIAEQCYVVADAMLAASAAAPKAQEPT